MALLLILVSNSFSTRERINIMATFNWFPSAATPEPTPLEKAKLGNQQAADALKAEQLELEKTQEMNLLYEERNRIKEERLVVKTATVSALTKFESLFEKEEEIDKLLTEKLSKWHF